MIGDHHGRSAGRATLLVRAADGILGTHRSRARACSRDRSAMSATNVSSSTSPSWPIAAGRRGRDADLLLCEASMVEPGPGEAALPQGRHLTGRRAAQYATRAGAGPLVLPHLAPG